MNKHPQWATNFRCPCANQKLPPRRIIRPTPRQSNKKHTELCLLPPQACRHTWRDHRQEKRTCPSRAGGVGLGEPHEEGAPRVPPLEGVVQDVHHRPWGKEQGFSWGHSLGGSCSPPDLPPGQAEQHKITVVGVPGHAPHKLSRSEINTRHKQTRSHSAAKGVLRAGLKKKGCWLAGWTLTPRGGCRGGQMVSKAFQKIAGKLMLGIWETFLILEQIFTWDRTFHQFFAVLGFF